MRTILRILSWPFLILGISGIIFQIRYFFQDEAERNPGLAFELLGIAIALTCIGWLFRWLSSKSSLKQATGEVKDLVDAFKTPDWKKTLLGARFPNIKLYDKRNSQISLNYFKNKVVVIKPWTQNPAQSVNSDVWKKCDEPRVVFLYVYTGQVKDQFQGEPIPKWTKARSYLLWDKDGELNKLGDVSYMFCIVLDYEGIVRRISQVGMSAPNETPTVMKYLKKIPVITNDINTDQY